MAQFAQQVQDVTRQSAELAFVDQGYSGAKTQQEAAQYGIQLPDAKKGSVLLPRHWAVERSFGWMARFRRLARDYERLLATLKSLHFLAFAILMLTPLRSSCHCHRVVHNRL